MPNMNKDVQVELFAFDKGKKTRDIKAINTIVDVVKKDILPKDNIEYTKVKVKVKNDKEGKPEYLILYKLRKDSYMADVAKVDIDHNYKVKKIVNDYNDESDFDDVEEEESESSYSTYDFVFATPVSYISTALDAVNTLYNLAINAGYTAKKLIDSEATVANYKHYLTSGLKGFVNVGHGNTNEIVLDDGRLNYQWFNSLTGNALNSTVVYFNSCQVFNSPLQPAVMHSGARTFVGGITNLLIGPSEAVCKCFWQDILLNHKQMGSALHDCESSHYPHLNSHGISGDLGLFRRLVIHPTFNPRDPRCMMVRPTRFPRDPRCMMVRPTRFPSDPRCIIIRPTRFPSDPRCMIRPTRDPSCMIRPTLKCPVRPTLTCGSHIPEMPYTFGYDEYYDPYSEEETWYDDAYDYWDIDENDV